MWPTLANNTAFDYIIILATHEATVHEAKNYGSITNFLNQKTTL